MLRVAFWSLLFCSGVVLGADSRPTLPAPQPSLNWMKNKSAREFFSERSKSQDCQVSLLEKKQGYQEARQQLKELLTQRDLDAIDKQEIVMRRARDSYLEEMRQCGDCAIGEMKSKAFVSPEGSATWYLSGGHCQIPIPQEKPQELKKAYERVTDFLTHLKRYPKENSRQGADTPLQLSQGFYYMLDFVAVDPDSGSLLKDWDEVKDSPFFAFLAVKGIEIFGQKTAVTYYIKNTIESSEEDSYFHLTFKGERPPENFQRPELSWIPASRRKQAVMPMRIPSVIGSWYVNQDGYLRYYTAANFGVSVKFAEGLAQSILLDTLATLLERGMGEE